MLEVLEDETTNALPPIIATLFRNLLNELVISIASSNPILSEPVTGPRN